MAPLPVPYELAEAEMVEPEGMTDEELASLCAQHESTAVAYYTAELASEQEQAINYYYGKMDDVPAPDGSSSAVDYSVAVMVDNMLAAVLKPFVSADEVVSFEPRGPEDVKAAEQATDYVNFIINSDNSGFQIFHDWFKDALLTKLGVVKVYWDENAKQTVQQQTVNAMQLMQLQTDPEFIGAEPIGPGMFNASFRRFEGRVVVENVPPEEFLLSPMTRTVEEAPYAAHKPKNYTRSDLILMGVDPEVVDDLPASTNEMFDDPRREARYQDEDWTGTSQSGGINSKPNDIIDVIDEYVRVDFDGDGIAELRRVVRVNDVILFNEEVEYCPFATLCPVPMPHKVYGMSVADQAIETQRVKTAIKRGTLDNLYRSNNPRPVISQNAYIANITAEDLQSTAPGAEIRVNDVNQIDWLTVPFAADKSFAMMEYVAQEGEERTGSYRKGHGMNSEALKKNSSDTATAASIDENARNERAEMVARIFAETGVKRLFKLILKLVNKYQQQERIVRLRNEFVPMNPAMWSPEMDLNISVGLGVGNKGEQIQQAMTVLDVMERLSVTPFASLVTPDKVYNGVKRLLVATGVKNVDDFLNDPSRAEPQPEKPDPEMMKVQGEMQMKQAELQMRSQEVQLKNQLEQAKAQAALQVKAAEAQAAIQIERERDAAKAQLAQQKAQFEADLALMKAEQELQLERARLVMQREMGHEKMMANVAISRNRPGGDLDK